MRNEPSLARVRAVSADDSRHGLPATDGGRRREAGVFEVDVPLREALEDLLQRYAALQSGQRGAEAEMRTHAERQMLARLAVNVEKITVGRELTVVAARSPDQHHQDAPPGDRLPVVVDIAGHMSRHVRSGWLVTQQFLHGLRDQARVLDEVAPLVRMLGKHLAGPADQPRSGLIAGGGDHVEVDEQFLSGQPPNGAGLVRANSTFNNSVMMSSDGCSARQ